jgi:hypothetical protein
VQLDLAVARQERLTGVADRTAARALTVWRRAITADFDAAWTVMADTLTAVTSRGQVQAAVGASTYLGQVANADRMDGTSGGTVAAGAFAGVDASGRTLDGLLYGAVTGAKTAIGAGSGLQGAFMAGATYLAVMVHTAVLDTGRSADLTAMTARRYTHYVRVVSAGACSRCAILAGIASAREPFLRHPRCRCTSAPITGEETIPGRYKSPDDYFNAMTATEQDRVFTKAGAEAIRAGADPITVVSARRGGVGIDYSRSVISGQNLPNSGRRLTRTVIGRHPDGTPIYGYTTGEGTTRRGQFARQGRIATGTYNKRIRLMPETIIDLTDNVELRQVLLRDAGYLTYPTSGSTVNWVTRRAELIRTDRATADAFYRAHGITLS